MSVPLLTAVTHRWESELAGKLGRNSLVHVTRRCADLPELLGTAAAGVGLVAVVSVDLRGLDRSAVQELSGRGIRVLGVHAPGDPDGAQTLHHLGIPVVISADAEQAQVDAALEALLADPTPPPGTGTERDRATAAARSPTGLDGADPDALQPSDGDNPASGTVVVVWGPVGSPGRTTIAVNLAAELARADSPAVVVDADTYGASIAQLLAVLDEAPGLAAAARAADHGTLTRETLARLAPEVMPGLRVLTGFPRADRWPELRERALTEVLEECRSLARWIVVDVAACLEADEELSFDTTAPRRNGAALAALDVADVVVVVGAADPVGLQRLVRGLDQLDQVNHATRHVVVTRVRATAVGSDPGRRIREALHRFAGLTEVLLVPDDPGGLDAAVLTGRSLREVRPASPARAAIVALAETLGGGPVGRARRTGWFRRRV